MALEHRIIHEQGAYRILEIPDQKSRIEDLLGDGGTPEQNAEVLDLFEREGAFGYVLERWNANVNGGWEHVDSCWGFIGSFTPGEEVFNHYIVDELKRQIPTQTEENA
jgi:hypothetical protein